MRRLNGILVQYLFPHVTNPHKGKNRGKKTCNIQEKLATQVFLVKNYNMKLTEQKELINKSESIKT